MSVSFIINEYKKMVVVSASPLENKRRKRRRGHQGHHLKQLFACGHFKTATNFYGKGYVADVFS